MVAFCIILAILTIIGVLLLRAHLSDSFHVSPGVGCGGAALLLAAGCAMLAALLRAFSGNPLMLALIVIGVCGLMAALYSPFLANLIGTSVTDFIYPTGGGEVRSYDIAEKLTIEGRYTEAVAEYERVIEDDPEDVIPRIRIADIHCRTGQFDSAAQALDSALQLDLPAEKWCHIANRLADVFAQSMYEPRKAAAVLNKIAQKYPHTEFARYACERVARLHT
jgi:tetratricopeptide (TPR) repeat protein